MQFDQLRRREFITLVGGAVAVPHVLPSTAHPFGNAFACAMLTYAVATTTLLVLVVPPTARPRRGSPPMIGRGDLCSQPAAFEVEQWLQAACH